MGKGGYNRKRLEKRKALERAQRKRHRRHRRWIIGGSIALVVFLAVFGLIPRGSGRWGVAFFNRHGFFGSSEKGARPAVDFPTPCTTPDATTAGKKTFTNPPCKIVDASKKYTVAMMTSDGPITIELDPSVALKSVNNFVFLAEQKYYDNTIFHRVQSETDFAIVQGGDPAGTGSGPFPGYRYGGETPAPTTTYARGVVAMANSGDPSSNGGQFFIVVHDWASLPANYTVFGHVMGAASFATLDQMIKTKGTPIGNGLGTKPNPPITLISATVSVS